MSSVLFTIFEDVSGAWLAHAKVLVVRVSLCSY